MSTGNRLMIVCMTLVALACIGACAYLATHGNAQAIAVFVAIAGQALSALVPSALHQKPAVASDAAVAAETVEAVTVAAEGS